MALEKVLTEVTVQVTTGITVDMAAWARNYGFETLEDIAAYVTECVTEGVRTTGPWKSDAVTSHGSTGAVVSRGYGLRPSQD